MMKGCRLSKSDTLCARRICIVSALGRSSFASVDSLVPRRAFRLLPFRRKAAPRFVYPLDARTRPIALTLHACGLMHAPSRATLLTAPVLLLPRFPSLRGLPHAPSHTNASNPLCALRYARAQPPTPANEKISDGRVSRTSSGLQPTRF